MITMVMDNIVYELLKAAINPLTNTNRDPNPENNTGSSQLKFITTEHMIRMNRLPNPEILMRYAARSLSMPLCMAQLTICAMMLNLAIHINRKCSADSTNTAFFTSEKSIMRIK